MWDQKRISNNAISETDSEVSFGIYNFIRWSVLNKIDFSTIDVSNEDTMSELLQEFEDEFYTNKVSDKKVSL